MQQEVEKMTWSKYYMQRTANGIKRFTQSKWMVAIVNAFISVMPIIITASIFTLLSALPEMIMNVMWSSEGADAWTHHINIGMFREYQAWAGTISNWSMGIIGLLATAAIARNLAIELNNKLPFERRMNEQAIFFAAISVYFMLSVIEFTVSADKSWISGTVDIDHTGRAIFVDGLAAQGILPGIIIGLTLPYIFYISYKRNWTIRLPKQVPQTICQAFLAIIPLFLTYAIYGSIAYGCLKGLGLPVLFWLFKQIEKGLTENPNLNDSYGLICIYTLMEGGFWFLGVHPEPVHALMRATFWVQNIEHNGPLFNENHLFIEPLMYGYGAMGGSGCTLMLPLLCCIFCRSTNMKVTGKTAVVPIIFQVNEPALFGVPTILNPIFAFPMIFTGMINDILFKAMADATAFQAGTLYLPWSTPYFLQTALPTITNWMPWVFNLIALGVCTLCWLPFVLIQDKQYLRDEKNKLGLKAALNFNPVSGFDVFKRQILGIDPISHRELKEYKAKLNKDFEKKLAKVNNDEQISAINTQKKIAILTQRVNIIKHELQRIREFNKNQFKASNNALNNKKQALIDQTDGLILSKQSKAKNRNNRYLKKIEKHEALISNLKAIVLTIQESAKLERKKLTPRQTKSIKRAKAAINKHQRKVVSLNASIQKGSNKQAKVRSYKFTSKMYKVLYIKTLKNEKKLKTNNFRAAKRFNKKLKKLIKKANKVNFVISQKPIKLSKDKIKVAKPSSNIKKEFFANSKATLAAGKNPWENLGEQPTPEKIIVKQEIVKEATTTPTKGLNPNRKYQVLVLCLGAGSSAVLANAINKGLKANKVTNVSAAALAWGQHEAALSTSDLVILSPQLGQHINNVTKQSEAMGFKLIACRGRDYINLTKDPAAAAKAVVDKLSNNE